MVDLRKPSKGIEQYEPAPVIISVGNGRRITFSPRRLSVYASIKETNIGDQEAEYGGMYRLRGVLGSNAVGLAVVGRPAVRKGSEHNHADQDHGEIYLLLDGNAAVTTEGETMELESGDSVLLDPTDRSTTGRRTAARSSPALTSWSQTAVSPSAPTRSESVSNTSPLSWVMITASGSS